MSPRRGSRRSTSAAPREKVLGVIYRRPIWARDFCRNTIEWRRRRLN